MSSHIEDQEDCVVEGFWKGDDYKKVVRRVEDGFQFCSDMSRMVQERAEIEAKYSHKLQNWSNKWTEFIEKGTEYGTCKEVLLHSLTEASTISEVHSGMLAKVGELQNEMKKWRGEYYKKQVMGSCKEAKAFEDEFKKAQKPWVHMLSKQQRYTKEKEAIEKSAKSLEAAAGTGEQDKKAHEKLEKQKRDLDQLEEKLAKVQKEIRLYRPIYTGDMEGIFERTQEFEGKRLNFIKDTLTGLHASLDVSQIDLIPVVYVQWRRKIVDLDPIEDLRQWALINGVYAPPPDQQAVTFEEKPLKKKAPSVEDAIHSNPPPLPPVADDHPNSNINKSKGYNEELNPFGEDEEAADGEVTNLEYTVPPPKPHHTTAFEASTTPVKDTTSLRTGPSDSSLASLNSNTTPAMHSSPPSEPTTSPQAADAPEATTSEASSNPEALPDEAKSTLKSLDSYKPELNPFGDSQDAEA